MTKNLRINIEKIRQKLGILEFQFLSIEFNEPCKSPFTDGNSWRKVHARPVGVETRASTRCDVVMLSRINTSHSAYLK